MLTIYDITGAVRLKTAINIGSKRVFRLMGDDYITLHFSLKTPIAFRLGDYCDVPGFGRFELCAPYKPTYGVQTGAFDYELKLEAQHMKWRNKIMRFLPSAGAAECSWALTATATTHLEQVLANIKSLAYDGADPVNGGYLYCYLSDGQTSGKDYEMDVDGSVDGSAKTISYDNTSILDALSSIAETFDCEWWLDDNIIRLGKCELNNDYIDLEIGKNVADMPHTGSKEDYATRLLVFGGERNISPRYRKELIFTVTEVTHGGSRILDGTRLLKSAWFSDGQRVSVSTVRKSAAFSSNGSKAVGSTGSAEVPVFTETREIANVGADRWKAVLSEFRPVMIITGDKGAATHVKFTVAFRGTASGGSSFCKEAYDQGYIQSAGKAVTASFADVALEISSEVDVLSVSLSYSVIMSGAGSVSVSYSPGSQSAVVIESAGSIERVDGIVIEKLGEDGSVEDTYNGAVLNPDGSEDIYEGSTIELPSPVRMSVGHRFRIANIIESRVKSSYFISKYAAFSQSSDTAVYGIASSRLMLPESYGKPYVDYSEGMTMPEGVEKVVVFDDIYPKAECHVTAVSTVERKETVENDDGTTVNKTFTAYCVKDDFFTSARPFSSDYIIPDHKLEITFKDGRRYKESDIIPAGSSVGELVNPESGKLNGWTFEVQFSRDSDGSAIWEIVRDDTSYIPNEIIKPEIGDTFVITGCDISVVDELMVDAAEEELLETARRYVEEMNTDPTTYSCTISTAALKGGLSLGIGKRVNLINPGCFESRTEDGRVWGRKSRIIGYETFLDKPFDKAIYTVGEKAAYSRFGEIEDKIKAMTASGRSSASGGSGRGVYVIGTDDSTSPTDTNVYSALRTKKDFLSRVSADVALGKIRFNNGLDSALKATFERGAQFGSAFVPGIAGGQGGNIDRYANAELESLILRSWLEVPELRFNRATVLMGDQWQAPGGGTVESVTVDMDNGVAQTTGTITLKLEDGEIGAIAVGDICKGYFHDFASQENNAEDDTDDSRGNTTFSGFCTVFFRVTEIVSTDGSNKVFKYALRPKSGRWQYSFHPYQAMHFVAYGNFNEADRQKSAYQTRTYTRYLTGVDDWEFDEHNVAMQFGDLSNLQIFGLEMRGYSAYLQNIYMSGTIQDVHIEAEEEIEITTNTGDYFIADGETLTLQCKVKKAWQDLTDDVVQWRIERDSSNAASDAAWNAAAHMYIPMFDITSSDVGATSLNASALFTVTAEGDGWSASKTVAVRTLRLPTVLSMRFASEYGANDTFVSFGDTVRFQAVIEDALRNDFTADYDQWQIVRHNGDTPDDIASDGVWNISRASISSEGAFSIEWSAEHDDLQAERATFVITAQKGANAASAISGTLSI